MVRTLQAAVVIDLVTSDEALSHRQAAWEELKKVSSCLNLTFQVPCPAAAAAVTVLRPRQPAG